MTNSVWLSRALPLLACRYDLMRGFTSGLVGEKPSSAGSGFSSQRQLCLPLCCCGGSHVALSKSKPQ